MMHNVVKYKEAVDGKPTFESAKKMTMDLPFGAGIKYKFNYNWALSGEFTFRQSFSDAIDYSVVENAPDVVKEVRNVGNPNSNDWINSATIIVSYSFGRPPCDCK